MKKIFIIIFILLIIFTIKLIYFNGEKVYTLKEYSPTGKLLGINEYVIREKDTVLHGKFINYNSKGNKIAEGNFVNGEINGKSIYYFDNRNIESVHYRKNSDITEESIYNYSNGNVKKYLMYDDLGMPDFLIRYDESGNLKSYEGFPLVEIYQYKISHKEQFKTKINQYLKVDDTLKYQYLIANIPNTKRSLKVENLSINNTKVKRTLKKTSQVGLEVKEILTKKGINKIRAIVKYEFNDKKKTVINDTVSFKIQVN